ncbi:MAG: DUF4105 domain-containing protein [Paraprevotella sp.]|nr:DUF4105 domain-containing protein [Paraprevotella sp.]
MSYAVPADSLDVSLLTCAPGGEIYELYGHTALRCRDYRTGADIVFNYGVFNFNTPHFVWRFTRGECDYEVRYVPFPYFYEEYHQRGSCVIEQVLNLTTEEKYRLIEALEVNCRPENRRYRYNFLYDNCTTRVRDQIERAVDGHIVYPSGESRTYPAGKPRTYRGIIHEYTAGHPWAELGNDLCLGVAVDTLIGVREQMFAPFYLKAFAGGAFIVGPGGKRPLVLSEDYAVQPCAGRPEAGRGVSPGLIFWGLCILFLFLTLVELRRGLCFWWLDALLMTGQGAVGLILTFLFFFSTHPAVDSNWQILLFNPVPLLMMPWVIRCAIQRRRTRWHAVNLVWLTLFILFSPAIPQDFTIVIVPLTLVLWARSLRYILFYRKQCVQDR